MTFSIPKSNLKFMAPCPGGGHPLFRSARAVLCAGVFAAGVVPVYAVASAATSFGVLYPRIFLG
jgi:hypothetical protein